MNSLNLKEIFANGGKFTYPVMSFSIEHYINLYRNRDLELDTPYQREFVWNKDQQMNLIRSIFGGIPVPPVVINNKAKANDYKESGLNVIDGKQRLTTIFQFVNDELEVDGFKYSNLTDIQKRIFQNAPLGALECVFKTTEEEEKFYNIFNFAGTAH